MALALRLVSVAGLLVSGLGTWRLVAASGRPSSSGSPVRAERGVESPAARQSPSADRSPGDSPSTSPSAPGSPSPTGSIAPVGADSSACQSAYFGYQVSYPTFWFASDANDDVACRFFDLDPVDATSASPLPATPIQVYMAKPSYSRMYAGYAGASDTLLFRDAVVGGHPAFVLEYASPTDDNPYAAYYAYVIDLGEDALVLNTSTVNTSDYAGTKAVLDDLAASLTFLSGNAG